MSASSSPARCRRSLTQSLFQRGARHPPRNTPEDVPPPRTSSQCSGTPAEGKELLVETSYFGKHAEQIDNLAMFFRVER